MNQQWDGIEFRKQLRTRSEEMVANLSPENDPKAPPIEVLMHELLVNKIELELQNEELRNANLAAVKARDQYLQLYELAPVGYITLTREGLIDAINLTGSVMLGVDRSELIDRHFAKFVAPDDRDRWHCQFQNLIQQADGERQPLRLNMTRGSEPCFSAYIDCWRDDSSETTSILRIVLIDVGKIMRVE